ncbi:VOLTAGE-DEPENDENT ANION-SELECTIVE CHANNEL [Salix koriyanagi]|uniref:VOLTAGE-DEPENDENT ANION-SELECTIVE CHANNEL n=1 Tax=Salix koriyanagi TaxID=2511006 RepID=A0A9Q1AMY6_9ROSI|nr:VOLTAGE-DEPENDENT ANION-SELECTIVE CHANNEL [Salix koriyanagi]
MADGREVKKREIVVGLTNNLHKLFKIRKPPKPKLKTAEVEKELSKIPTPPKPKSNAAEVEKEKRVLKAAEVEKELSKIPKPPLIIKKAQEAKKPEVLDSSPTLESPAYDLLSFGRDQYFSISTGSDNGLTLIPYATTLDEQSKAGVTAEYKREDIHATIKVDAKPGFPLSANLAMSRTLPFMRNTVLLRFPDFFSGEFQIWHEARYIHEQAALAMTFPALRSPLIQLSATVGTPHLGFGMQTAYNTSSRQFTMLDAGISLTNLNCDGSIILENRGDFLSASYIHYFDHERKVAAAAVIGRTFSRKENAFAVGGAWIVDDLTTIKTRYDSFGKVVTALQHKIKPKSSLTIIGEFEPKALDKTPSIRLGLSLVL